MPFHKLSPQLPARIGTLPSPGPGMRAALFLFIFSSNWLREQEVALIHSDSLSGNIHLNKKWFSNIINKNFCIAFLKLMFSFRSAILSNIENLLHKDCPSCRRLLSHTIHGASIIHRSKT